MQVHLVAGTTGSGKTAYALKLAAQIQANGGQAALINVDSRQVYKYLPIGTNREPSQIGERSLEVDGVHYPIHVIDGTAVEIYLTDFVNPDQNLDVYTFRHLALAAMADAREQGKTPILVGGTGMYIDSLLHPEKYSDDLSKVDAAELEILRGELSSKTLVQLQEMLTQLAPDSINQINSSDWRNPRRLVSRIIRERVVNAGVNISADNVLSAVHSDIAAAQAYEYQLQYLEPGLEELQARLESRARAMWDAGLVPEVEQVLALGYPRESPALQGIGFRQVLQYLDGELTAEAAIVHIARAHFQYAKRQLTWFRKYLLHSPSASV